MQRHHRTRAVLAVAAVALLSAACSGSGDDGDSADRAAGSDSTSTTVSGAASGAAEAARAEADSAGEPILPDGSIEVPAIDGGTAVYEIRNLRLTGPIEADDCPGGSPVNPQRLVADLTARLVPTGAEDPNVIGDDQPMPIPYVSQLPEIVLVGVGDDDTAGPEWFVGISPVSRLLVSMPNTYLRPAPAGDAGSCAIEGWEPTDLAEPVGSTEMLALSSAFVPADFDPADYQFRIGRGDENAYCWPLDDLGTPAELGRCR